MNAYHARNYVKHNNKVVHKLNWTIAKFLSEDGKVKTEKEAFSVSSNLYGEFC